MANASKGYFALTTESVGGTAETTPVFFYPVEEVDFTFENEFVDFAEIAGSRQAYTSLDGAYRPDATFKGALYADGAVGAIFYGLLGDYSTAAAGTSIVAFTHSFLDAASLPYFTLERSDARNGEGGLLCERLAGCKVESVSLSCSYGEKVDFSVGFQAMKKPETATAVAAGSITYPSMIPFYFKGAVVKVDSVANSYFKSIKVDMKNTLMRQESLRGTQEAYSILEGGLECTLTGTLIFEDLSFYNYLKNGTEIEVALELTSDTIADAATTPDTFYSLVLTYDIVRVAKVGLPFKAGDAIEAEVTFKIIYDKTNQRSFTLDLTNLDVANAYDAV